MECVLGFKRGADLEIVSFRHGMSPVQGAAKSLAVKWLYFLLLKSWKTRRTVEKGWYDFTLKDTSRTRNYTRKPHVFRQIIPPRRLIKISGQDNIDLYRRDGWVVESARLLIWWSGQTDPRVQIPLSPLRAGGTSVPLVLYSDNLEYSKLACFTLASKVIKYLHTWSVSFYEPIDRCTLRVPSRYKLGRYYSCLLYTSPSPRDA